MRLSLVLLFSLTMVGSSLQARAEEKPGGAHATVAPTSAAASAPMAPSDPTQLKGKIAERVDAGGYMYLRLTIGSEDIWVAVPETTAVVGDVVLVTNVIPMDDFESRTLNRRFKQLYFGTVAPPPESAACKTAHAAAGVTTAMTEATTKQVIADSHASVNQGTNDKTPIKVKKADGPEGRTVAELFAQKAQLKNHSVAVRGKVVKVNENIMGRTWVHLRDGSGSPDAHNNDLAITTKKAPGLGDVVLVKGTLHLDKGFGAYQFPVIIEDAAVTP